MPFVITVGFATEQGLAAFDERILPKLRGQKADPSAEEDGLHRTAVAVTSQTAARDLCHQIVAFLAHSKTGRVNLEWEGTDGSAHNGVIEGGSARQAEILAVRIGAAAKAHLDQEKSPAPAAD